MQEVTIDDLKKVIALSDLPDEHLQWILDHSIYREFQDGESVTRKGEPIDHMWIMLEGHAEFYMDINGKQVYYYNFENND